MTIEQGKAGRPAEANEAKRPRVEVGGPDAVSLKALARQTLSRQQREVERRPIDTFNDALNPPHDWRNNQPFKLKYDNTVAAVIDQAAHETRLEREHARLLRSRLGLPVAADLSDDIMYHVGYLEYLDELSHSKPGRLRHASHDKLVAAMVTTVRLFAHEKLTVDEIVEQFDGDVKAELLLKGAVSEILLANIHATKIHKRR